MSKPAPAGRRKKAVPVKPAVAVKKAPARRERANGPAQQPARAAREHASVDEIRTWVLSTGKSQAAIAQLCGLPGGPGPLGAALHGRPLSRERFARWQAAYVQAAQ